MAELAGQQHGVVSRAQLLELGESSSAIGRMVEAGRLHPLHRGVYAVGHRVLGRRARYLAATLATGGVLSHRSAGALRQIHRYDGPIELTVRSRRAQRPGLRLHFADLPPDEVTTVDGIPVTTTPRTLLDLAAVVPHHRLERAVNEVELRRLTDVLSVPDLLSRHPRRPGSRRLSELVHQPAQVTRSELEVRFLALVERFGLPRPDTNASRGAYELDATWPGTNLIVELDGRDVHSTRLTFDADRERDRKLQVAGWRVVRLTDRQLREDAAEIARDLAHLLGATAPPPPP